MEKRLEALPPAEAAVLARVRLSVTARLTALVGGLDPGLSGFGGDRPFALALAARGLPPAWVLRGPGGLSSLPSGGRPRRATSLLLRFGAPERCARILSGGSGLPLPLPLGPGAFAALAWFRAASAAVPRMLADPDLAPVLRARLLAEAALGGVAEVGSSDPWMADRLAHAPSGSVLVECPGSFALVLEKGPRGIRLLDAAPASTSARLSFRDAATAVGVFTGAKPAILSLASGDVAIRGLVPLVQALFAVLDRLGDFLAVRAAPRSEARAEARAGAPA